jgi:hypothetical protein
MNPSALRCAFNTCPRDPEKETPGRILILPGVICLRQADGFAPAQSSLVD